ncbi:MAG: hypothetical protein K0S63_179 [Gammaproteobacteria bacterium]|nr:hypothetical protein [Gammaproteobacteria bacterium]
MTVPKIHIKKAHDHFFRMAMSDQRVAREFFEAHLPAEIRSVADLNCLELQSGSYIDDMRQESIADMLFKTIIKEQEALLYLIVDHQSRPDKLMPFRILKYSCNIIDQHLKDTTNKSIPLIIPLVVYHGKKPWVFSTNINDLVDAPKELVEVYFLKPFKLIDLHRIEDAVIKKNTWAGVVELTLKHIFAKDILPYLYDIVGLLQVIKQCNAKNFIETVFTYIIDRGKISDNKVFFELVRETFSNETGEDIMTMTIAESLRAEGRAEGKAEGKVEGKAEGKAEGREQEAIRVALDMLEEGFDKEIIARLTKLTKEKIDSLSESKVH